MFPDEAWPELIADHAPPRSLLVATEGAGRVIGYCAVHPEDGELYLLFVDPAWGGRGVRRALLAAGHDALRAAGCVEASLYTEQRNERALGVYAAAGYRRDGTVRESDFRGVPIREVRLVTSLVAGRPTSPTKGPGMTLSPASRDPRVDAFVAALPEWQQDICREVRELVHAADQEVEETIKRTTQPYFVLEGNICALLAARDHVNVFLYDGGIVADPEGIITGGHDNKTARMISIHRGEAINAEALKAMFEQIIANNRAGGWRRLKRQR